MDQHYLAARKTVLVRKNNMAAAPIRQSVERIERVIFDTDAIIGLAGRRRAAIGAPPAFHDMEDGICE
jgi:hypothetical protein